MTGIHTAVVRFQNVKRNMAVLEVETPGQDVRGPFVVVEITAGSVDVRDEIVGNLDRTGAVDLFNRTRHDHIQATISLAGVTRDDAVAYMKD